jgi:putative lipase involved disintegration of autophagic bodies
MLIHCFSILDMLFKENNGEDDGSTPRTYDEIVSILKPLLEQYPDYKLFMTGLGLGGALATICSLYLACNSDIPTPVTCVSYGSPRVGDRDFLNTVQLLEKKRHLRIIRVVCNNDIVTTVPYFGYVHVGFEVRLFHKRDKEPLIKYPNLSWGVWKWTELCWQNSFKIGLNLGKSIFGSNYAM